MYNLVKGLVLNAGHQASVMMKLLFHLVDILACYVLLAFQYLPERQSFLKFYGMHFYFPLIFDYVTLTSEYLAFLILPVAYNSQEASKQAALGLV